MIISTKFGKLKKNGEAQFYVRLISNASKGKRLERKIKVKGIVMSPSMLNLKTWRVRSSYPQAENINEYLLKYRNRLSMIKSMFDRGEITFEMAANLADSGSAVDGVLGYIDTIFAREKNERHVQNCRESAVTVTNILGLDHLTFADINEDNLLLVRKDLLEREKSPNSFNHYYRDLRTIWKHAYKRNFVVGSNPFRKEIIAKVPPSRLVPTVTPEHISAAINRIRIEKAGRKSFISAVGRFQSVAMWLLKFSMRGLYRKDIETLSAYNLDYDFKRHVNAVRKGYHDEVIVGNSLILNHYRHKSGMPMRIFIGLPPILSLIRYLRLTIAYTHPTLSFNSREELGLARTDFKEFLKSVPDSRVDPLRLFKPVNKDNKTDFSNYWRLLGKRREEIGLPNFKLARHTFITYSDGLGIAYTDSQQLAGHKVKGITDNYINKRTNRHMARLAKSHLEVLQDFSALDLFELLLNRSKEVLGDFGEYLNDNCQLGFYKSFINQDLHNFLEEKMSIPNQRQYKEMKEMISSGGIDAVKFAKEMYDSFTEAERKVIDKERELLTDDEAREMFKDFLKDNE